MSHPSDDIRGSLGRELEGKRIVLAFSGSVAVLAAVELGRLLVRHGARVYPVMSRAATRLVGVDLVHWACGERPITRLSGAIEHVALAGNVGDPVDLVVVAPATANTVGKIAAGIDDTPVTTFVTTAWGEGIPILIVPAMHESMYRHPVVRENLRRLAELGLHVMESRLEEGKAKLPPPQHIVETVISLLCRRPAWAGKRVVITAGRTEEPLDAVRVLTNPSSGRMGMALARAALRRGARVDLALGVTEVDPPPGCAQVERGRTVEELGQALRRLLVEPTDVVFATAAVGDYKPSRAEAGKHPTQEGRWIVELVPTPKLLSLVRSLAPKALLVSFRALSGVDAAEAERDARQRIAEGLGDLVAFNDVSAPDQGFRVATNRILLFDKEGLRLDTGLGTKQEIACKILDEIEKIL